MVKRYLFLISLFCVASVCLYGQEEPDFVGETREVYTNPDSYAYESRPYTNSRRRIPARYINLSYGTQKTKFPPEFDNVKLNSDFAVAFTWGRTYFLHKKPLADRIRFGIDATYLDMNYGYYTEKYTDEYDGETGKLKSHQAEIGVQVGPSVTVNPVNRLFIHSYFRYAPSFSGFYNDDAEKFYGNYASFFVVGGRVTYGCVGLGVEARWSNGKYRKFGSDDDDDYDPEYDDYFLPSKIKLKTSGARFYLTFRF